MKARGRTIEQARADANAVLSGQTRAPRLGVKRRSQPHKLESAQGMALIQWADMQARTGRRRELQQLRHIPNGGARSAATGGQLKAEGVRAGTWDYVLPVVIREPLALEGNVAAPIVWPGLWIELKIEQYRNRKQGGLSDEQVKFGVFLREQGYATVVAYDWTEARDAIEAYLDAKRDIPFFWAPKVSHEQR